MLSCIAFCACAENKSIDPAIDYVKSFYPDGEYSIRIILYDTEEEPCIRAELLTASEGWKVVESKELCTIKVEGHRPLNPKKDLAAVYYENFELENNNVQFDAYIAIRRAGGFDARCKIAFEGKNILPPACLKIPEKTESE